MGSSGEKPGSSVQISAKAEAKVGIQATVPEKSVGRLVDALTDIIRPFSETRGLRADQIRLQREDVAIKIAEKALERLALEGVTPNPVPSKIIVPLLEAGSIEDIDDAYMVDTWASLLASASRNSNVEPRLIGILRELHGRQAKALEQIAFCRFEEVEHPIAKLVEGPVVNRGRTADDLVNAFLRNNDSLSAIEALGDFLVDELEVPGSYLVVAMVTMDKDSVDIKPYPSRPEISEMDLEILASLGVLACKVHDYEKVVGITIYCIQYYITDLGLRLLSCCGRLDPSIRSRL